MALNIRVAVQKKKKIFRLSRTTQDLCHFFFKRIFIRILRKAIAIRRRFGKKLNQIDSMYGPSYPRRADHLQRYRITFNFPDVPIDLVRSETYILTLLLVRHVRQDQSLPCTAFQWHPAIGEDLSPPDFQNWKK